MAAKYIFRLDDICPTMNWRNFNKLTGIFEKYGIKPILGVVSDNKDAKLVVEKPQEDFWEKIKNFSQKGWVIAQHGFRHEHVNDSGGILKIGNKSEFSNLSYVEQFEKIGKGKEILENRLGIKIKWWMAPSHSFDKTTCGVLKVLGFDFITDGIALYPFEKFGITWIPQQLWKPRSKLFGVWTICIHPNTIDDEYLRKLEIFIKRNINNVVIKSSDLEVVVNCDVINKVFNIWWNLKFRIYKFLITIKQ